MSGAVSPMHLSLMGEPSRPQTDIELGFLPLRLFSIFISISAIVFLIVELAIEPVTAVIAIRAISVMALCALLLGSEFYAFRFLRYFRFLFRYWGKSITCIIIGLFLFRQRTGPIIFAVILFLAGIVFLIAWAILKSSYTIVKPWRGNAPVRLNLEELYRRVNVKKTN
jgi:hypothetical protein